MEIGIIIMETSIESPQKIKNKATIGSSNHLITLWYVSKGTEIRIREEQSHVHCNINHNAQDMETTLKYLFMKQ